MSDEPYLCTLDWEKFAYHYNGPAYAQNQYDQRLAKAYEKHKAKETAQS